MTLEQMLKWKNGSFEEFEKLIRSQERLLKQIKKINEDIEWAGDAIKCFNSYDKTCEKYKMFEDKYNKLVCEKEKLSLLVKENNIRLEKEFY